MLDNYIARHSFLVCSSFFSSSLYLFSSLSFLILYILQTSLAAMRAKKCRQDLEGRLQATKVAYEGEIRKLEKEKEDQRVELLATQKKVESSGVRLREAI